MNSIKKSATTKIKRIGFFALLGIVIAIAAFMVVTKVILPGRPSVGDYVKFGSYPQTKDGMDNTPIEWQVLAREGNKVLLISRYALDAQRYSEIWRNTTWESCTLRTWLNEDFINRAFTEEEQKGILVTEVDNSKTQCNSNWEVNGGNNTHDKVFLLSYAEAVEYFGGSYYGNVAIRVAETAYAHELVWPSNGRWENGNDSEKTADGEYSVTWWLRSPGYRQDYATWVYYDGQIYCNVNDAKEFVRPALWVDLDSGLF